MTDTKNALVTETFDLANTATGYMVGAVIPDMPANQFADLEAVGLVREATAKEVKAAPATPIAPALLEPAAD